ncbi:hypothetical protein D3C75_909130 [compost metagenome]
MHVNRWAAVVLLDFHRRMRFRSRRPANQQRQRKALALHLFGNVNHFVQRRRNQARQTDNIGPHFTGGFQDLLGWHHHAKVDDFVVITLQHYADDVFADVVNIAFHRRQHDFTVGGAFFFAGFNVRFEVRHGLFHYAG